MNKDFVVFKILGTILCIILCIAVIFTMKINSVNEILLDFVKIMLILFNIWAILEIWGFEKLCKILGHKMSSNSIKGIVYCKRCHEPMYRINKK